MGTTLPWDSTVSMTATVVPIRAAGRAAHDLDRLRLRPDDVPAAKADTRAASKRRAARDRLFVPSTPWPEFAAAVAAGVSGRAVGLWAAIRMQARLEGEEWMQTHLREGLGFGNRAAPPGRWRSWSGSG